MFLRAIKRHKDGKLHLYWTLVENVRAWRRVFQRQALYLGELNDSQRAEWQRAIEAFDEKGRTRHLKLFPADRAPAEDKSGDIVKMRMDKLAAKNLRGVAGAGTVEAARSGRVLGTMALSGPQRHGLAGHPQEHRDVPPNCPRQRAADAQQLAGGDGSGGTAGHGHAHGALDAVQLPRPRALALRRMEEAARRAD